MKKDTSPALSAPATPKPEAAPPPAAPAKLRIRTGTRCAGPEFQHNKTVARLGRRKPAGG